MSYKVQPEEKKQRKLSFFECVFEVIGWLQIVASPLLAGLVVGAIIYFSNPGDLRLVLAIFVAIIGLLMGIVFATRVWKKQGTIHFVSRVMATPELDKLDDLKKEEMT